MQMIKTKQNEMLDIIPID